MKVSVLGGETVELGSLLSHEVFETVDLGTHFIAHPPVFVFPSDTSLVFGEDPRRGMLLEFRAPVTPRADKIICGFSVP